MALRNSNPQQAKQEEQRAKAVVLGPSQMFFLLSQIGRPRYCASITQTTPERLSILDSLAVYRYQAPHASSLGVLSPHELQPEAYVAARRLCGSWVQTGRPGPPHKERNRGGCSRDLFRIILCRRSCRQKNLFLRKDSI